MEEYTAALEPSEPSPKQPPEKRKDAGVKDSPRPDQQPQQKTSASKPRRIRVRYSNKMKVLLLYLITWSLAILIPLAGVIWAHPLTQASNSPYIAKSVASTLPLTAGWLEGEL